MSCRKVDVALNGTYSGTLFKFVKLVHFPALLYLFSIILKFDVHKKET